MNTRPIWRATPETDAFIKEIFQTRRGVLNLASVFNVDTDRQLWYYIPGFNGYEMSDYGLVRSMKYFQRCPFGMLIKFDDKENYILSDNNNDRVRINRMDLWDLVINNPRDLPGYPRVTSQTDCYSRNKRMFLMDIEPPLYGTRGYGQQSKNGSNGKIVQAQKKKKIKSHVPTNKQEPTFFPEFTVVPDGGIDVLEFVKGDTE